MSRSQAIDYDYRDRVDERYVRSPEDFLFTVTFR